MYGLCLLSNYALFLTVVPLLAHCDLFRLNLLPRISHLLNFSKVPVDQYLLAVGVITFFVYFAMNLALDVVQTIRSLCATCQQKKVSTRAMTTNTPTSITIKKTTTTQSVVANDASTSNPLVTSQLSAPCNVSVGLTRAHQQAVHYYPAFVSSTFLIWANTNKFDSYSLAFVMVQVLFLFVLPFSYMCPHPIINHINRIAYQCALLWTLAYAIYPRDVGFLIDWACNNLYTFFSPAPTDIYYTPIL